jgi:competence protein ComEA
MAAGGIGVVDGQGLRERLASLERREKVGLAVVGALIVAGAAVWYLRSLPSSVHVEQVSAAGGRGSSGATAAPGPTALAQPRTIVVYVAGRVRHPGVYTFDQGDRVVDAIERAGGALSGSDLTSLNLAALLTDSEQIVVGKAGGVGAPSGTSTGSTGASGGPAGAGGKVDINTATVDQLEALPGIGPVLAQRIIDFREAHGPFRSVKDLTNVSGIGDAHMADLEPLVTV